MPWWAEETKHGLKENPQAINARPSKRLEQAIRKNCVSLNGWGEKDAKAEKGDATVLERDAEGLYHVSRYSLRSQKKSSFTSALESSEPWNSRQIFSNVSLLQVAIYDALTQVWRLSGQNLWERKRPNLKQTSSWAALLIRSVKQRDKC
jgi:hypothetical protein